MFYAFDAHGSVCERVTSSGTVPTVQALLEKKGPAEKQVNSLEV